MTFRVVDSRSLNRRLSSVMAAPASVDGPRTLGAMLDEYLGLGGDGLHLHGEGGETRSRQETGRWLCQRNVRDQLFICTPIGHAGWDEQAGRPIRRLNSTCISEDISQDLELLGTDYLDLVYFSEDDPTAAVGDLLEPLIAEQERGRIRAFGVSQWTSGRIREANRWARQHGLPGIAAVITTELALATPTEPLWPEYVPFDAAMRQCVAAEGLTTIAWVSDLNQGLCLFGHSDPVSTMKPAWVRRWQHADNDTIVASVKQFAADHAIDLRQVNTAYVLNQPFPVVGLVALGVPHCGELATYARASQLELSEAERRFLRASPAS